MKNFIFLVVLLSSSSLFAQDSSKILIDTVSGKPMLVGEVTREAFSDTSFSWWYNSGYEFYEPDTATIDLIKDKLLNTDIVIIMGTWCSDSRREIPNLFKILDYAGYPEQKLKMVSVARDKKSRDPSVNDLNVELIPTIIFYSNGEELGRIIEAPQATLEEDMAEILQ